jgi:hypothetical protein
MYEKAKVSSVIIAGRYIECLMLPDGSFRIAVSQVSQLLPEFTTPNNALRELKALLGKDSSLLNTTEKILSELHSQAVNTVTLETFNAVILELGLRGNETAKDMLRALSGASLLSVVSDAFGVKFTQEQTVEVVFRCTEHLNIFYSTLTVWWKSDGAEQSEYSQLVDEFKLCANLPAKPVSEYSTEELQLANTAETIYCAYRRIGISHEQALLYF